jgi:glycosyltransferase involved in cell wall biosynthesis
MGEGNKHPRTLSKTGPKIIFYGKLQKLKGIEEFIKAGIKLLGRTNIPFQFEIFGHEVNHHSHSYTDQLKKLIPEKFQANFNFRGRISIDSLEKIARDCEVAVIPSRFETFCLAAHELNWLGIPLVLNRIDAFKDYFSEENCWYFDEKQPLDQVLATIYSEKEKKLLKWNGAEMNHRIQENSSVKLYHSIITDKPSVPEAKPETPLVSIVVPYYNMEKYINATLDSILNSTYRNYEVIVIDDGSNNQRSVSKFKNLSKEYPASTFQFLSKENGGLGSARNFGIRQAKGKYILPLDSDDIIHHQYLELAVNALEKNPSLTAVNSFVNFFLDGTRPDETIDYVIPYDLVYPLILIENRAGVACSVFRAEIFKKISYNEELKSYEDWELWWKFSNLNLEVETLPVILYHYRRRADSMVNQEGVQRHIMHLNLMAARNKEFISKQSFSSFNLLSTLQNEYFVENIRLKQQHAVHHPSPTPQTEELNKEAEERLLLIKEWYGKEYEVLPLWFKRVGHLIKIVQGHRSFKSVLKKNKN